MSDEQSGLGDGHPYVDADAVCEQCATVNPPGTLLCKACGNNLRDQLQSRETGEIPYDVVVEPTVQPRRVLAGLLGIFGLLVILWTAWNVNRIEGFLAGGFTSPDSPAIANYWTPPRSSAYDKLVRELKNNPIRPEEVASALAAEPTEEFLDGRYVLVDDSSQDAEPIGEACCRLEDATVYFVARLHAGSVEVRGRAGLKGSNVLEAAMVGVRSEDSYREGKGIAERGADGGFDCYGISIDGTDRFQVIAYRIP